MERNERPGAHGPSRTWRATDAVRAAHPPRWLQHPGRLLAILVWAVATTATAQVHVALVLDASGSMYNRLDDGRYRIDAAKAVLQSVIAGLPDDDRLDVGLRVYGARMFATEEGACEDSHLEVPIAGVDRAALSGTVAATVARGATPIVRSLELTLDDLPASGDRRVVLVTDGLESCGGDLTAIAERYGALGIDLRIIGIDLDAEAADRFAAVATFVNAGTAVELGVALQDALGGEAGAARPSVAVRVSVTRDEAATTEGVTVAFVDPIDGVRTRLEAGEGDAFAGELPPGTYAVELVDAFADGRVSTVTDVSVPAGTPATFTFELAASTAVSLTVEPPGPTAGTAVQVEFAGGPDGALGAVVLAPAGAPESVRLYQAVVSDGRGEVELLTPDVPGTFEARFLLALPEGGHRVVGRSEPFETAAATATLEVPSEISAGTRFDVQWEGPGGPGDRLELHAATPPGADHASTPSLATVRTFTRPASLLAPPNPGAFEVRYVTGGSGTVLAAVPVTVVEAQVTVVVPEVVDAGAIFEVRIDGAVGPRDALILVRADAPDEGAETIGPARRIYGATVGMRAPDEPGSYEVRYLAGPAGRAIAQRFAVTVR